MDYETKPNNILPTRDSFHLQGHMQAQSEGVEKDIQCKWKLKESRGSYTFIRQVDFNLKAATRDEEGHYIVMKGTCQKDRIIVNIYAHNIRASKYTKQILTDLKGK